MKSFLLIFNTLSFVSLALTGEILYGHGGGDGGLHGGIGGGYGGGGGGGFGGGASVHTITQQVPVSVPQPYPVTVNRPVPVPVPQPYPVVVSRPVQVHVPRPYPVEVPRPVQVTINRPVPYPVPQPIRVPYQVPVQISVPQPYPVTVPQPYPVRVPQTVVVPVPQPVHVGGETSGYVGEIGGEENMKKLFCRNKLKYVRNIEISNIIKTSPTDAGSLIEQIGHHPFDPEDSGTIPDTARSFFWIKSVEILWEGESPGAPSFEIHVTPVRWFHVL
ncbi:hypothetical protein NQ317_014589 [Molorchus minor]|uniref:Uncharacterized protein n=1 Tax=Molorchus minor TaxID=1323400 RepID=A0ABQ9K2D5_9CUCU|nr:hypothetical protein NQ317_014589 [Molorchus minor]